MTDKTSSREQLILTLIGAISGILSLAILTEYVEANMWLSPILGILAIIFIALGLSTDRMDEIKYEDTNSRP